MLMHIVTSYLPYIRLFNLMLRYVYDAKCGYMLSVCAHIISYIFGRKLRVSNCEQNSRCGKWRTPWAKITSLFIIIIIVKKSCVCEANEEWLFTNTPNNRNEQKIKLKSKIKRDSFPGHPADIMCDVSQRKPIRSKTEFFPLNTRNSEYEFDCFGIWLMKSRCCPIYLLTSQPNEQTINSVTVSLAVRHFEI